VPDERPARAWHVFATYGAAVAGIVATTILAIELLRSAYPDVSDAVLVRSLPGLLVGALAASSGLLLTLLVLVRPLDAVRLRLRPGWETGPTLAVMVLGLLALSQALDSVTRLTGVAEHGSLGLLRQALERAGGTDLFAAVLVLGFVAGGAEEIFFRGYMQWRLREHWSARAAVQATSVCFALLHGDVAAAPAVAALALGLYLGVVAEVSGSTLPAIVCHVVNNVVYKLQTALGLDLVGRDGNLAVTAIAAAVVVACVLWVRRAAPGPTEA
jgi:membrane protease YdiL (CAAX protease family)